MGMPSQTSGASLKVSSQNSRHDDMVHFGGDDLGKEMIPVINESLDSANSPEPKDDPNGIYDRIDEALEKIEAHLSSNRQTMVNNLGPKAPRRQLAQIPIPMTQLLHQLRELGVLSFKLPTPGFNHAILSQTWYVIIIWA